MTPQVQAVLAFVVCLVAVMACAVFFFYRRSLKVAELNQVGLDYQDLGRLDDAVVWFRRALRLDDSLVVTRYNLAWALQRLGRADEAVRELKAVVAVAPDHAAAYHALGYTLLHDKGDADAALPALARAAELMPRRADIRNTMGLAHARKGAWAAAEAALRDATRIDPAMASAQANLGVVLVNAGKDAEAVGAFETAVRLAPTAANHANLGNAMAVRERDEEAVAQFKAAIALEPGNGRAHYWLGSVYQRMGRIDEAVDALSAAVRADERFAPAHANLAEAFRRKGDDAASKRHWDRAVALDPNLGRGLR